MYNGQTMIDKILQIITENPRHFSRIIKKDSELHAWVTTNTSMNDASSYAEQIYSAVYSISDVCVNGNHKKFVSFNKGYAFCGRANKCECALKSVSSKVSETKQQYSDERIDEINSKRTETTLKKYGVTNNAQTEYALSQHKKFYKDCTNVTKTLSKMQSTCIEKYGVANAMQNDTIATKSKDRWLSLYGKNNGKMYDAVRAKSIASSLSRWHTTHPSKNPKVIAKMVKTNLERRGVEFSFQDKGLLEKSLKTQLENKIPDENNRRRYQNSKFLEKAVMWFGITDLANKMCITETILVNQLKRFGIKLPRSKGEYQIVQYIKSLGIANIKISDRTLLKKHEIDIFLPDYNLAIEFNGIYWHTEQQNRGKTYHVQKTIDCEHKDVQLLHIPSNEWENDDKRVIWQSIIKNKLHLNNRVYARKCALREVPLQEAKKFFNNNHLQGFRGGSIKLGLYCGDELVQALIIGKSRYNKKYQYELIRMASSMNTTVVGGFSKLLASVDVPFITYADRTYSNGKGYKAVGLTYHNTTAPGSKYVVNGELHSRVQYQKHKLKDKLQIFNEDFSEYENMVINGFDRIWDCGNIVFTYDS